MVSNEQICKWKKDARNSAFKSAGTHLDSLTAKELFTKWKTVKNTRRIALILCFALVAGFLVASFPEVFECFKQAPMISLVQIILLGAVTAVFSKLIVNDYFMATDVEECVKLLPPCEIRIFNAWAHDLGESDKPCVGAFRPDFFVILSGTMLIEAIFIGLALLENLL